MSQLRLLLNVEASAEAKFSSNPAQRKHSRKRSHAGNCECTKEAREKQKGKQNYAKA